MKRSLHSIAQSLQLQLIGDGNVEVGGIASIAEASPSDLVFVEDVKHFAAALESRAAAIVAGAARAQRLRSSAAPARQVKNPGAVAYRPRRRCGPHCRPGDRSR